MYNIKRMGLVSWHDHTEAAPLFSFCLLILLSGIQQTKRHTTRVRVTFGLFLEDGIFIIPMDTIQSRTYALERPNRSNLFW